MRPWSVPVVFLSLCSLMFGCEGGHISTEGVDLGVAIETGDGDISAGDGGSVSDGAGKPNSDGSSCQHCTLGATECDGANVRTCVDNGTCIDWGDPVSCGGLVCSGGACVAKCSDQCAQGAQTCSGDGYRTCIRAVSGCLDWSAEVTACAADTSCSGGICVATCVNRCHDGDQQCSGASLQTCGLHGSCYDWSDPVPCAMGQTCTRGACATTCTDACTLGSKRCAGASNDSLQTCARQPSGCLDWNPAQACDSGVCSASACVPCTDGQKRCGGAGAVEQCSGGLWGQVASCAFGCSMGACTDMVSCTAGAHQCNGNTVEICNSSGTAWLYAATCTQSCSSGLCTGACTAASKRCNGGKVEKCSDDGTSWSVTDTCANGCDDTTAQCALASLDITMDTTLDGEVIVNGPVVVHQGATVNSPTGNLRIRATSITVQLGASIVVDPTGKTLGGKGPDYGGGEHRYSGAGGGYGTSGDDVGCYYGFNYMCFGGSAFGATNDAIISAGSPGGANGVNPGGLGGGVLSLIAPTINMAGQLSAKGAPGSSANSTGSGSGGGILIAGDHVTVTGAISVTGGNVTPRGGIGRVKILYGSDHVTSGMISGVDTIGILPPLTITSSSHPDPNAIYNDDFGALAVTWNQPFSSRQGYYQVINKTASFVPTAANGQFVANELLSIDRSKVSAGKNYFHLAAVDAASAVGTVENNFQVQINTTPPGITSMSHPVQATWSSNQNVHYEWTFPTADSNLQGGYYVLDHFGNTIPTKSATFLPISQKQLLRSGLSDGIWVFHLVSMDQKGYLTKQASHYQVHIGSDPGAGNILGQIVNTSSQAVVNAKVTLNRGLISDQVSDTNGNYSYATKTVPAGTWELTVSAPGYTAQTQMVTVAANSSTTVNFTLNRP